MDNRPSIDRELLIPILIGGLSVVGIILVLLLGRAMNAPAEVAMTPSATSFRYIYLGTEPGISTPILEGSEVPLTEIPPVDSTPAFETPTLSSVSTVLILPTLDSTSTSPVTVLRTSTPTSLAVANTYDDTDSRLLYAGSWVSQTNVTGAYAGTLHVSSTIGDSITFSFTGPEIRVFYQAAPSLGSITITIDGLGAPPVSQAQSQTQIREWVSNLLSGGTHTIVIEHYSGGSVNIDSLIVPAPTATPTRTPTQNQ